MRKYYNNKLGKTRFLILHDDIKIYIPETRLATKGNLREMLDRYRMVYVKPSLGTGGHGVMKAEVITRGNKLVYQYKLNTRAYAYGNFPQFYRSINGKFGKRKYLIQKGIRMLRYGNRPFDIRVMVQKNEHGE